MGYWARIDEHNIVNMVTSAEDDEIRAKQWLEDNLGGNWLQCSYNTRRGVYLDPVTGEPAEDQTLALRGNYPGRGYEYHSDIDGFVPPQPFPSWQLNKSIFDYEAPIAYPTDGKDYEWDEESGAWVESVLSTE